MYRLIINNCSQVTEDLRTDIINLADDIINSFYPETSLLLQLNVMQAEYEHAMITKFGSDKGDINYSVFNSKYTIPDYFVNLILSKYNMKIEEVMERNPKTNDNNWSNVYIKDKENGEQILLLEAKPYDKDKEELWT